MLDRSSFFPLFVTNTNPLLRFCSRIYASRHRHNFFGRKTSLLFPLHLTTALPQRTASMVMNCSSETRIPVEVIVCNTSASRSFPIFSAVFTRRAYSLLVNSFSSLRKFSSFPHVSSPPSISYPLLYRILAETCSLSAPFLKYPKKSVPEWILFLLHSP